MRIQLSLACLLGLLPLACTAQVPAPGTTPAATPSPAATASEKVSYSSCNVEGPYIAMTFDDGPHGVNTPRLLDMLKQRNIKATFYMVGECAAEYPAIVKRMVEEGHEVANHSWNHPSLSKLGDDAVKSQLQRTHDAIVKACGVAPKTMRPPYGAFTERQRRWAYGELGYKTILWDVDPLDWKVRNAAHVESEILKHTVKGSIILSHDIHKSTVDAMPGTLDALLAKGFKFVTVSELIAMDKPLPPKTKPAHGAATPAPAAAPSTTSAPAPAPAEPAPVASGPATTAPATAPAPAPAAPAAVKP